MGSVFFGHLMALSVPLRSPLSLGPLSGQRRVARELLPCPVSAFSVNGGSLLEAETLKAVSRTVRSRVRRRAGNLQWMESGINTMNELYARPQPVEDAALSSGQCRSLDEIRSAYAQLRAPVCKDSAAALDELCGHRPGYGPTTSKAVPLRRGTPISLPPPDLKFVEGSELLGGADRIAWEDWRHHLLRTPAEFRAAEEVAGKSRLHVDKTLTEKPAAYAAFLGQLAQ